MPVFEFLVEGPPKTANAKNRSRYNKWVTEVRTAAKERWPAEQPPLSEAAFAVHVVNYYRETKERPHPPDVDNVLKPILDALKELIYTDDLLVRRVISERYDITEGVLIDSELVSEGMRRFSQFLTIRVGWEEAEE